MFFGDTESGDYLNVGCSISEDYMLVGLILVNLKSSQLWSYREAIFRLSNWDHCNFVNGFNYPGSEVIT